MIETKGPSGDPSPIKWVLCEEELIAWEGANVGQSRLGWRPEPDREECRRILLDMVLCLPAPLLNLQLGFGSTEWQIRIAIAEH